MAQKQATEGPEGCEAEPGIYPVAKRELLQHRHHERGMAKCAF